MPTEFRRPSLLRTQGFLAGLCEKSNITVKAIHPSNGYARSRSVQEIDDLEGRLAELERRMVQMNASYETMNTRYLELTEMKYVLRETAFIFDEVVHGRRTVTVAYSAMVTM